MGAGYHGGFGHSHGENKKIDLMRKPILKRGDVRYNAKKVQGYLLNINHPEGSAKAKFMRDVLGYTENDAKIFHNNIVKSIINRVPNKTILTTYGVKHIYNTVLVGKNGNKISANIVVVVQKDNKRVTYKIVTVYPNKKGK
ncbi:MAG: hypothetical protein SO373_08060 [Candidatus Borkfalkiaceae bacterium]|nr:hypothetical protein [Christensenellaceae bacterium]